MGIENNIEWLKGNITATAFFTQGKYINRIKKLAEQNEDCEIFENNDGSILAHFPVKWIKISPTRQMSEERKQAASKRFKEMWEKKREENEA